MTIDAVTLAVMANRLDGVVREMTNTMIRTARSTTMAAQDFSCSITSSEGDLLSCPEGIPVHVYGSSLLARSMVEIHPDFREGDAFMHNDPYMGNSHAADQTILVPVFYKGELMFIALAKWHQIDIGNSQPTTYMPNASDVYEEGALIFPCVRVESDYRENRDILRICQRRIRVFDSWYGDYLAALGAARLAERRVKDFCARIGSVEDIREFVRAMLDYGERVAANAISKLPSGRFTAQNRMDPFPNLPDGLTLQVTVDVDAAEGRVVVDLRDNPDCTPTGLNLTESTSKNSAISAVLMVLNSRRDTEQILVPNTSGSHRRIEVLVRENCVAGIPRHPASCSTATTTITDRVTSMILVGFAKFAEGAGSAEACLGCPPREGVVSGWDRRGGGRPYIFQIFSGAGGGPGTGETDGWLWLRSIVGGGIARIDSSEVVEQRYPIIVWQRSTVREDSEGPGCFRGAPGENSMYGPRFDEMRSHYYMEGVINRPTGVRGGGRALGAEAWIVRTDGRWHQIRETVGAVIVQPGEAIATLGGGGGGYGSPWERDAAAVLSDVADGFISVTRAREVYRVALMGDPELWETLAVDAEATTRLRKQAMAGDEGDSVRSPRAELHWWTLAELAEHKGQHKDTRPDVDRS